MTQAGFVVNYPVTILGDGVTTVFTMTLAKKNTLGSATLIKGGLDIGSPVDVGPSQFAGATISLSGLTVTLTFATAPAAGTYLTDSSVQVIYG